MPKYIIEPTILALKEKTILISNFNYGEKKKKFIAKDPNNYENRKIEKEEQAPINLDDVEENTSKKKQTQ